MRICRPSHPVAANGIIHSFSGRAASHCVHAASLCIHLPTGGSQVSGIVTSVVMDIGAHVILLFKLYCLNILFLSRQFSPGIWQGVGLVGHLGILELLEDPAFILFSTVAVPIPTNSAGGIPFLYIFTNICYLFSF